MIFSKRNAIVGFATLKLLEKYRDKRRKKEERALRTVGLVIAAVVSVGVLAGVAAAIARKHRASHTETLESDETDAVAEGDAQGAGNGRLSPEPAPAA